MREGTIHYYSCICGFLFIIYSMSPNLSFIVTVKSINLFKTRDHCFCTLKCEKTKRSSSIMDKTFRSHISFKILVKWGTFLYTKEIFQYFICILRQQNKKMNSEIKKNKKKGVSYSSFSKKRRKSRDIKMWRSSQLYEVKHRSLRVFYNI